MGHGAKRSWEAQIRQGKRHTTPKGKGKVQRGHRQVGKNTQNRQAAVEGEHPPRWEGKGGGKGIQCHGIAGNAGNAHSTTVMGGQGREVGR